MAGFPLKPGSIQRRGDELLMLAENIDVRAVKARLERFRQVHRTWSTAAEKKETGHGSELEVRSALSDLDALQDKAVDLLASKLVAEGFDRMRPFSQFKVLPPSRLKQLGDAAEAKVCLKLTAAIVRDKRCGKASKAVARDLARAAREVLKAAARVRTVATVTTALRKNRDELNAEWLKAWRSLRQACQLVEGDGGKALYTMLFKPAVRHQRPKTRRPAVTVPATGPAAPK